MAKKNKYYVVWQGHIKGVFNSWSDCKKQINGYASAQYKSFESLEEANDAFKRNYFDVVTPAKPTTKKKKTNADVGKPIAESIAVDAACSGNPGKMEYQGVYTANGKKLFHLGPLEQGTNNIGEFLALVHGLAFLQKEQSKLPIYSDSKIAISWIKNKKCKTNLEQNKKNTKIFELIQRAENWLANNQYENPILKWETAVWGEIPADFGRK